MSSSGATPPEHVYRLRSIVNTWSEISTRGNCSRSAEQVLPVDRRAIAVEQTGLRERVAAGAQRAEWHALRRQSPQRGDERR